MIKTLTKVTEPINLYTCSIYLVNNLIELTSKTGFYAFSIRNEFDISYFVEFDTNFDVKIYKSDPSFTLFLDLTANDQIWIDKYDKSCDINNMIIVKNNVITFISSTSIIKFELDENENITEFHCSTEDYISYGYIVTNKRVIIPNTIGTCDKTLSICIEDVSKYDLTHSYLTSMEITNYTNIVDTQLLHSY